MRWLFLLTVVIGCDDSGPTCPAHITPGEACSTVDQICLACECVAFPGNDGAALKWSCEGPPRQDLSLPPFDLASQD